MTILCTIGFHKYGRIEIYEPFSAPGIVYYRECSKCSKRKYVGELS